ncbi:hypothetical protein P7K49_014257, partial [Saguinus oedipus]
ENPPSAGASAMGTRPPWRLQGSQCGDRLSGAAGVSSGMLMPDQHHTQLPRAHTQENKSQAQSTRFLVM